MAKRYLYKNIRALLTSGFNDEELRNLCYDEPELKVVHDNLPKGTGKVTFIQELIDRAERRVRLDKLLELAREHNEEQYNLHRPYYEGEMTEAEVSFTSSPEAKPASPPMPSSLGKKAIELFFSYSHKDEALRDELATHLKLLQRQGVIKAWHDRQITAGSEWAGEIDEHLDSAQIILLLISADFIASDYCYDKEMMRAMARHEARQARVIPVILRPVDWKDTPFEKLQALPKNAQPVISWPNRDEAWVDVAKGIRRVAEELARKP